MPGLRSLRNRLAVIFALIIIGAIGTIYLSVTPRLEASLTSQRLRPGARHSRRSTRPGRRLTPLAADRAQVHGAEDAVRRTSTAKARTRRPATAAACASSPSAGTPS